MPNSVAERFYVYQLIDPRDGEVFYVGKGCGQRSSQHARDAIGGRVGNAEKFKRISAIHADGERVVEHIVHRDLSEAEALRIERQMIGELREQLTNIRGGNRTNAEVVQQQAAYWLGRMKTYDEWIATARPEQISAAASFRGSARAAYDDTVAFWRGLMAMPV